MLRHPLVAYAAVIGWSLNSVSLFSTVGAYGAYDRTRAVLAVKNAGINDQRVTLDGRTARHGINSRRTARIIMRIMRMIVSLTRIFNFFTHANLNFN